MRVSHYASAGSHYERVLLRKVGTAYRAFRGLAVYRQGIQSVLRQRIAGYLYLAGRRFETTV